MDSGSEGGTINNWGGVERDRGAPPYGGCPPRCPIPLSPGQLGTVRDRISLSHLLAGLGHHRDHILTGDFGSVEPDGLIRCLKSRVVGRESGW